MLLFVVCTLKLSGFSNQRGYGRVREAVQDHVS